MHFMHAEKVKRAFEKSLSPIFSLMLAFVQELGSNSKKGGDLAADDPVEHNLPLQKKGISRAIGSALLAVSLLYLK